MTRSWMVGVAATVLAATAADASTPSAPTSPMDPLAAYAGTWDEQIDHLASPYGAPSHEKAVLKNECGRSAQFFACNQFLDGVSKALVVYTAEAQPGHFKSHVIQPSGEESAGELVIAGDVWTFPWIQQDGDKTVHMRITNRFNGPNVILFFQEYSPDGEHWTVMARGVETRQP